VRGMTITLTMDDTRLSTIQKVEQFTRVAAAVEFCGISRREKYAWIEQTIIRFRYRRHRKKNKSAVKQFVMKMTGYSDIQTKRLIGQYLATGKVLLSAKKKHRFPAKYTPDDVALLVRADNAHARLSDLATKRIFEREFLVFRKSEYERLSRISVSHLYNLRGRRQYISHVTTDTKTPPHSFPSGAAQYLAPDVSFENLEAVARRMSDTEYATMMQKQKAELLKNLSR